MTSRAGFVAALRLFGLGGQTLPRTINHATSSLPFRQFRFTLCERWWVVIRPKQTTVAANCCLSSIVASCNNHRTELYASRPNPWGGSSLHGLRITTMKCHCCVRLFV